MITARLVAAAVVGALALASASLAAGPSTASAVFRVRADLRMCPSPRCGGYWVSRVNRATTTCADGTTRPWCYVAGIDHLTFVPVRVKGTDRNAGFLLRGRIVRGSGESWSLGRLIATDKWIAATAAPWSGAVYLVSDTGVRCVRAPCFSMRAATANTARIVTTSDVDLSIVAALPALVRRARMALTSGGLLVAGTIRRDADGGRAIVASQFFLPAV